MLIKHSMRHTVQGEMTVVTAVNMLWVFMKLWKPQLLEWWLVCLPAIGRYAPLLMDFRATQSAPDILASQVKSKSKIV